MNLTVNLLEKI